MLKLIGLALISFVCLGVGYDGFKKVRAGAKNTESFLRLVRHIESEISYKSPPLCEIYARFDDENFKEQGIIELLCKKGLDFAIESIGKSCDAEAMKIVRSFCAELGKNGRDGQISLCKRTAEELDLICRKVSDEAPKKAKVYLCLSFSVLLCALIIIV